MVQMTGPLAENYLARGGQAGFTVLPGKPPARCDTTPAILQVGVGPGPGVTW